MTAWKACVAAVIVVTVTLAPATAGPALAAPEDRAVVRGRATLDGAPFDATFIGAAVEHHGLVTPCQVSIPPVDAGRFLLAVFPRSEAAGCGAPGSKIRLWTFVQEQIVFATTSVRWPGEGGTVRARPTFSMASPDGGLGPLAGFGGEVFDEAGRRRPPGTRVEAFIGTTRCAVASVRRSGDFTGYSMDVVGPDAVPGCTLGATITFRVDGRPAAQTAVNQQVDDASLDLTPA